MQCPKCESTMQPLQQPGAHVRRCSGCDGLWFEAVDHERLKHAADAIDTGDAAKGADFNRIDRILCPVCIHKPLIRMVDPQQPHIWFESCTGCHGRFYDAGEFRDFAEHTLAEYFADLDAPERT